MPTTVVTGVAGSLGRRVAAALAAEQGGGRVVGIDVVDEPSLPAAVEFHRMDLAATGDAGREVEERLAEVMAGADGVVHLAWRTADAPAVADEARPPEEANRVALARVLVAAGAATTVTGLVHLSSATVYGAWPDNRVPLTEDTALRPNPEFSFATGKAAAERVVADWAEHHPAVAVAVLRPAVTVGNPERPLYLALGATRFPGNGDGSRPVQFLHVDDLADAVVEVGRQRLRGVFNVAPDSGIAESVARALSGGVAKLTLPARVSRPLAAWGWERWRRGVPREARAYTLHPWVVAPDRLKAAGWQPRYTSEEALVATDERPHFDDLPPGRRQNVTMLAVGAAVAGAAAATAAALVAVAQRRRRR